MYVLMAEGQQKPGARADISLGAALMNLRVLALISKGRVAVSQGTVLLSGWSWPPGQGNWTSLPNNLVH
jgi:hypothetical protein